MIEPRITEEQLHKLLVLVPRSETVQQAARLVWLDGFTKSEAARQMGCSRQGIGQMLDRLRKYFPQILGIPAGWEIVSYAVPPYAVKTLQKEAKHAVEVWMASHPDWAPSE